MQSFVLKANDSRPDLVATLEDASGPVNLTGASVQFRLASTVAVTDGCSGDTTYTKSSVLWSKPATIDNAATGAVRFAWSATDTAVTGYYLGEFVATFSGGAKQSFPTTGYIPVVINESLS